MVQQELPRDVPQLLLAEYHHIIHKLLGKVGLLIKILRSEKAFRVLG